MAWWCQHHRLVAWDRPVRAWARWREMHHMHTTKRFGALLLGAGLVAGLGACSDDDGASTTTTTADAGEGGGEGAGGGDLAAACQAELDLSAAFNELPFPEGDEATDEELAAARSYYEEAMGPAVEALVAAMPPDGAEAAAGAKDIFDEFGATGDVSLLEDSAAAAVFADTQGYLYDNCDSERFEATAVEYEFRDIPDTIPAGVNRVRFTNGGDELHEIVIFRRADGESRSFAELLDLGEEESEGLIEYVAGTFAPQGEVNYATADFAPGSYAAVCFVPTGTTSEDQFGQNEDAPPHFAQGMIREFTAE